jgi:peptide/nickel transport system substrate-binding protein
VKNALVAKQQLEEVGFAVDVQVVDWATLNSRTQKPELWEVFSTGFVFSADPANHVALRCTFQGWWCNEEKEKLLAGWRATPRSARPSPIGSRRSSTTTWAA